MGGRGRGPQKLLPSPAKQISRQGVYERRGRISLNKGETLVGRKGW